MSHADGISSLRMMIFCVGFVCLLHLIPKVAAAQSAEELAEVQAKVKAGDTVRVTEANGKRTTGRFESLSGDSIRMVREGVPLSRSTASIQLIERRRPDPLWNGVLIGAAPGIAMLVGSAASNEGCAVECLGGSIALVGIGAGVGAMIDASKHRYDSVYRAAPKRTRFDATPLLSKDKKGLALTFRF